MPSGYIFELTGGALCLDFANTLGDRPRSTEEHLARWTDLLAWGVQASVLPPPAEAALRRWAGRHEREAAAALAEARVLREAIYRIFSGLAAQRPAPAADLSVLNDWLRQSLGHLQVSARGGEYQWAWDQAMLPERVLWPIVRSAADLLVSPERAQLRECQSETCSWLFVDRSRTKQRRWCSMSTCGNRAKVRRFHERQRQEKTGERRNSRP
jgi:predicted RNA-binding Zn ribbon-like protein